MSSQAAQAYYDDFSTWYDRERARGYHALLDDIEVSVATPLARGGSVLEVGCGTGLILERLAKVADRAVGVDLSPGMLAGARERGLSGALASATALPFADDSFDLAVSFKVLAHVSDIAGALAEMVRVVRPGGRVLAEFYNFFSLCYLAKRLAGPGKISDGRTEADVYTRWDSPLVIPRLLPPRARLVDYHGVRVLTPAAFVHRLPVVGDVLRRAEVLSAHSPLRYFGGFLVAELEKTPG